MNTTASRTSERRVSAGAVLRFAAGNVALGTLVFLGALATLATAGSLLHGSTPVVTVSDSMSPAIKTGDLLITRVSDEPPKPGSILVFRDASGQGLITHRLVSARDDDLYVTRGDANPKPDSHLVPADDVIGVGTLVVPLIGAPVVWYSDHGPATLLASGGGLVVLILLAAGALRPAWDPWARPGPSPAPPVRCARRIWRPNLTSLRHGSLIVVAIIGLGSICQSSAAFADITTTGGNAVNAAEYFPCTSFPTYTALNGFEYTTREGEDTDIFWDTIKVTLDFEAGTQSDVVRNGGGAFYVTTSSWASSWIGTNHSGATYVGRFAIRLNDRPTTNATFTNGITSSGASALFGYDAATQRFTMGWSGATPEQSTAIMQTGQWHLIEYRIDVSNNPRTIDWRIDGVPQTSTSLAQAASTVTSHRLGSTAATPYTMYLDDFAVSATWADYPIGDGRILPLQPNSTEVVGGATFREEGADAVGTSSWQKILVPDYSTYIRQTTTSATSYVQIGFENTPRACVRGVSSYIVYSGSSTTSNDAKASIMVGSTERVIRQGTFNGGATWGRSLIAPESGTWTPEALNTVTGRFGFSNDVSPEPRLNAIYIEYETR